MNLKIKMLLIKIARIAIAVYLILILGIYFAQEKLIFFPRALVADYKFEFKGKFEERITQSSDFKIHSLVFKAPNSKGVILGFHGNAGAMNMWGEIAEEISDNTQWDVWMVDYPGYGKSTGTISSQAELIQTAEDVYAQLKKEYPTQKIILYGRSLGTGFAVKLASEGKGDGLILETPYTSLTAVGQIRFPWVPGFIMRYPMPSVEWIGEVKSPILILHGDADETVPFEQGLALSKIRKDIQFLEIKGGHHNNLAAYDEYWSAIKEFTAKVQSP